MAFDERFQYRFTSRKYGVQADDMKRDRSRHFWEPFWLKSFRSEAAVALAPDFSRLQEPATSH